MIERPGLMGKLGIGAPKQMIAVLASAAVLLGGCAPRVAPVAAPSQPVAQTAPELGAPAAPLTGSDTPTLPGQTGNKIGLLLPLSGQNAALGRSLLQAAEMGLFDTAGNDFSLLVRDSARPGGSEGAARDAIADGAKLILGPVFGSEVRAAASPAQAARVPLISFSNDITVAGQDVYVLGVSPQSQVSRVVDYAVGKNLRNFAVIAPDSPYGRLVRDALRNAVRDAGGQLVISESYDPNVADPSRAVAALGKAYATRGFDAIMLAEGGQKLSMMASLLQAANIPLGPGGVRLLGTSLWSDPSLAAEPALKGGWFVTPPLDRWKAFDQRYQELYGMAPDPRAGIVYDAVTLGVALARGGDFSNARLTDANGFAGVSGVFRFQPSGQLDRGLTVMEIQPGGAQLLEAAPGTFVSALTN